MDPGHDSGTRADTKVTVNEVTVKRIEKSKSTHSVSSSSSESSEEDFFQMDQKALPRSHTSPASSPKPLGDVQPEKIHESLMHSMSTTQYPPIQVMERTGDYEPNGFPPSIFARNSSLSKGWSITSNESLFSLNLGNNSLSRDHPLLFEDLYNSEFYKSDELKKSGELNWYGQPPPPHVEGENDVKCVDMGEKSGETQVSDEKVVPNGNVHNEGEVKLSPPKGSSNSPISNCQSDGRGTSTQPLAFPRYTLYVCRKKSSSAWRFCQCFHGWWTFCYDCKRERNARSSPSSEENLTNDGTRTSKKGSLEKKDSQVHSKKSWCRLTPCSCSFRWCC